MILNGLLNSLRLNANVMLCCGGAAVLQEALNQCNVITIGFVNLSGIPFAEAVRTDTLITQVVTDDSKLLLNGSCRDGKDQVIASNTIAQAVIFNVLCYDQRNGKHPPLPSFLLNDLKTIALTIPNNAIGSEFHNVADAYPQIALQHKSRGNSLIWAATTKACFNVLDNLLVLLSSQCFGFFFMALLL